MFNRKKKLIEKAEAIVPDTSEDNFGLVPSTKFWTSPGYYAFDVITKAEPAVHIGTVSLPENFSGWDDTEHEIQFAGVKEPYHKVFAIPGTVPQARQALNELASAATKRLGELI